MSNAIECASKTDNQQFYTLQRLLALSPGVSTGASIRCSTLTPSRRHGCLPLSAARWSLSLNRSATFLYAEVDGRSLPEYDA